MEYIHNKPVAAGLCVHAEDYKYSSASYYESGKDEFGFHTLDGFSIGAHGAKPMLVVSQAAKPSARTANISGKNRNSKSSNENVQ